ncbi:uncharacterized protein CMU_022750 [Cryptosporidium muris RN66]|uniref:BRCT domain-containing protein n=1 Tax=Cryptosporidium muris (strain RN66) TaxID=441375 RepID=B6ABR7_CRYMR|nr:uncharacterized protein CMU_022750 [Cryptosporidium muris RN66]EEA05270.1 hypothetical protein, conserved [Cryptosporidium muris RN66]|eukprot:XP_002139619.1 hypothetical protein [Cryptosporidium muris RN66]
MESNTLISYSDSNNDKINKNEILEQAVNDPKDSEGNMNSARAPMQFVINEVSSILRQNGLDIQKPGNINNKITNERKGRTDRPSMCVYPSVPWAGVLEISKSVQLSTGVAIRSNSSFLLSLTALLANPHHTSCTMNSLDLSGMSGILESRSSLSKDYRPINASQCALILHMITCNLQHYVYEGNVKSVVINDLVTSLLKAYTYQHRSQVKSGGDLSNMNYQAYIEAREWSVMITPTECIFPKSCFELRDLLHKSGLKVKSYFESNNEDYSYISHNSRDSENLSNSSTILPCVSRQVCNSSIDDIDTRYFGNHSCFAKRKAFRSNNIPFYHEFERIKRLMSKNNSQIKSLFHSPGSSIYITGDDVVSFLHLLKSCFETNMKQNSNILVISKNGPISNKSNSTNKLLGADENTNNTLNNNILNIKSNRSSISNYDPFWFIKETKKIVANFPVRDTVFKAATCDCNYIHNTPNSIQASESTPNGFYELKIEGFILPYSLANILTGIKMLCSDISNVTITKFECTTDPPFLPAEISNLNMVWDRILPILCNVIKPINLSLVNKALLWRPISRVYFKDDDILVLPNPKINPVLASSDFSIINNAIGSSNLNITGVIPFLNSTVFQNNQHSFSLPPRKRPLQINQSSSLTKHLVPHSNGRLSICNHSSSSIGQQASLGLTNTVQAGTAGSNTVAAAALSSILLDFSLSNGIVDSMSHTNMASSCSNQQLPLHLQNTAASSSSFDNSNQQSNFQHSALTTSGVRNRPSSLSTNIQWMNFRGVGFANSNISSNSNYVSLGTPMGKQLLHRIGTTNPFQRLEQVGECLNPRRLSFESNSLQSFKIFSDTALCFLGFDTEKFDYFSERASDEGAKIINIKELERGWKEHLQKYSNSPYLLSFSGFVCSWLQVVRFYCILGENITLSNNESVRTIAESVRLPLEIYHLVTLEWFLTTCFEKRPLDPDVFGPLSRPSINTRTELERYQSNIGIIILDKFPHMNRIYNSSKHGQASLSHAIWTNSMQRILKNLYGPTISGTKEVSEFIGKISENLSEKNEKFVHILVIPCSLSPYKSEYGNLKILPYDEFDINITRNKGNEELDKRSAEDLTDNDKYSKYQPLSTLQGSSFIQFKNDIEYLKKACSHSLGENGYLIHIISPKWLLDSCNQRNKVDYKSYELEFRSAQIRINKRKKIRGCNEENKFQIVLKEETIGTFYNINTSDEINSTDKSSLIPSQGPWPLWSWNVTLVYSNKYLKSISQIKDIIRDLGASICCFVDTIGPCFGAKISKFTKETNSNLIVCTDTETIKFLQLLEMNFESKTSISVPIVDISWIHMVHGTRTLHPFECKYLNSEISKKVKDKNIDTTIEDITGNSVNYIPNDRNSDAFENSRQNIENKKFGENTLKVSGSVSKLLNTINNEEIFHSKNKENTTEVNFYEMPNTELLEHIKEERTKNTNKRRKSTKLGSRRIENYQLYSQGDDVFSKQNIDSESISEFLVPISAPLVTQWFTEDINVFPMTSPNCTPVRNYNSHNKTDGQFCKTPSNWISPVPHLSEYFKFDIGLIDGNNQFEKNKYQYGNIHEQNICNIIEDSIGTTTENVSPILCPILPTVSLSALNISFD